MKLPLRKLGQEFHPRHCGYEEEKGNTGNNDVDKENERNQEDEKA